MYIRTPLAARKQIVLEVLAAKKAVLSESLVALFGADFLRIQKGTEEYEAFFMETINVKNFIATFAGVELQPAETPYPKNVLVLQDAGAAVTQDANAPLIDANADFEFEAKIAEMIRYLRLREKVQNYLRCLFSLIRKYLQRRRFWNNAALHGDLIPSEKSIGYTVSDLDSSDVTDTI